MFKIIKTRLHGLYKFSLIYKITPLSTQRKDWSMVNLVSRRDRFVGLSSYCLWISVLYEYVLIWPQLCSKSTHSCLMWRFGVLLLMSSLYMHSNLYILRMVMKAKIATRMQMMWRMIRPGMCLSMVK